MSERAGSKATRRAGSLVYLKSHAKVVVIGGGVVGASVLYHLTKAGWKDVLLIERAELTSGSTWHAAGGMHTVNGDPNVAKLQQYTIELYKEIERISGAVLRRPHHRRPDAGRYPRAARLAEDGQGARPLSRHGPGDHFRRRGGEAVSADGEEAFHGRDVRSRSKGTSIPTASPTPMRNPRRSAARKSSATPGSPISNPAPTARGM